MSRFAKNALKSVRAGLALATTYLPGSSASFGVPRGFETSTFDWFRKRTTEPSAERRDLIVGKSRYHHCSDEKAGLRPTPAFVDEPLVAKTAASLNARTLPRFVASLHRGRYVGVCFGSIVTEDDCLLQDVSLNNQGWCREVTNKNQHNAFKRFLPRLTRLGGEVLALNTPFSSNYHHFLLDTIPRLGLCEEVGIDPNKMKLIVTDYNQSRYQVEMLTALKIDLSRLAGTTSDLHLQAETLHVPSISEPVCREEYIDYTREGMEFVRRKLRPPINFQKKRRLLLSRRLASSRRWIEEEQALPELEKLGFVRVECELLSVAEQARLFGEAEAVIMPHGGGMANCVFCEPGTKLFELFHPSYYPVFMLSLSHVLGLSYHAISGTAKRGQSGTASDGNQVDVYLSPSRMLEILRTYL